ncbi:MAG TPA: TetR/AcrR family transcriptional regulator [Phenylobacterium sp.]
MAVAAFHNKRDQAREAIILDVARDCFLAEGYAATSMSTIAARLGGSKGTLYNYFKNKEDLFAAVVQRECGELQATLFKSIPEAAEGVARLPHLARAFLEKLMSPQAKAIHRLVIGEGGRFPEIGRIFYESGPSVVLDRIGADLQQLMDEGRLRRADPLMAAQQFKDLAISGVYWPHMWGAVGELTEEQIDEQVARAVDTFLRAYAV